MTSKIVQYERGFADRVFDLFGTPGFNVSEDGRLGWYGPDSSWYANPGDWIYLDGAGNPAVSRLKPVSSPPMKPARLLALVEVLTDEAMATCYNLAGKMMYDRMIIRRGLLGSRAAVIGAASLFEEGK